MGVLLESIGLLPFLKVAYVSSLPWHFVEEYMDMRFDELYLLIEEKVLNDSFRNSVPLSDLICLIDVLN